MFTLSLFISQKRQSFVSASLDLLAPPDRTVSKHNIRAMSRPGTLCRDEGNLLNSVTQQERNYFRQLWF